MPSADRFDQKHFAIALNRTLFCRAEIVGPNRTRLEHLCCREDAICVL